MRLNTACRESIAKKAMAATFDKELTGLQKVEAALGVKCYGVVHSPALRKQIAALPDGWVKKSERLRFNVGGQTVDFVVKGGLPVCSGYCYFDNTKWHITDRSLVEQVREWQGNYEDYKSRRKTAEATLVSLLAGISSSKILADVWPEGKKFYGDIEAAIPTPPGVPAIRIAELNSMLGIAKAA